MLYTRCQQCNADCQPESIADWVTYGIVPCTCPTCGTVFWVQLIDEQQVVNQKPAIPRDTATTDLPDGTLVYVSNLKCKHYGCRGRIAGSLPEHYRIIIDFSGMAIAIRVPKRWVTNVR